MTRKTTLGAQFAPTFHRPFLRYFNGENGATGTPPATPPAEPPATPPAPPAPVPTPPPAATPPAAPPAQPTPPVNYRGTPDEYVRELREEAKGHRVSFENEQTAHTETKTKLASAEGRTTSLERENFILRNAAKFGVNADVALDSNSFMTAFAAVDLSKDDDVKAAFETALEKNSALKAGPGLPSMSGGGHQGGQNPATPVSLEGAVAKALGG